MSKTIPEIVDSCVGLNEKEEPKAAISFNIVQILDSGDKKEQTSVSIFEPEISLKKIDSFMTLDLRFKNPYSATLKKLWSIMELFGKKMNNFNLDDAISQNNESFEGAFTIVPLALKGTAFIMALNPIYWCLMPSQPNEKCDTIRLLFIDSSVGFFEGEEIDVDALKESVLAQQKQDAEAYNRMEERLEEEEEYRDKRNKQIEELRGNPNNLESPLQQRKKEYQEKKSRSYAPSNKD